MTERARSASGKEPAGSTSLIPREPGLDPVAGAVILAGGRGSRMGEGEPKPLRILAGRPLIAHVADRLGAIRPVVVNAPADGSFDAYGDHVAPDLRSGFQGPLAGIEAGMDWLGAEDERMTHALVLPSDTPFLPNDLVPLLLAEASSSRVLVASHRGRLHPTVSLWPITLLSTLAEWLDDERPRAIRAFLDHAGYRTVSFDDLAGDWGPEGDPFANVNTPEDLAQAERRLEARAGKGCGPSR
ncbi:molybdenum cofactor guanylyltransferase [Fulvimarina endophytica]|uniref:Molybdenum cofactor guanylyltransferase n=1 Tax=Fulvimarina endophytica TaxID=2293836 RepID=A0A371X152_9HYPH|nr:molybdenum cofactor guanylyltransferase [Fulvimarina endophytica]RFC62939.1 molybdenum cofactor guanylyltransferase [Fulvimarina endophytica]